MGHIRIGYYRNTTLKCQYFYFCARI
jgi:hypothetical protein